VALKIQPKCPHVVEVPAGMISRVIAEGKGRKVLMVMVVVPV
jgi:hypothetical protein